MRLRDGSSTNDARLNRIVQFDDRSRHYMARALLTADQQSPRTQLWTIPTRSPVLDQGQEGACVGFGVTNELRFRPVPVHGLDETFARQRIYWEAQKIDPWPGGSYPGASPVYEGTSVLAGVKAASNLGFYGEYRWAFGEPDLALAVSYLGPVILGLNWYSGMFRPDPDDHYIQPTGTIEGGHCILCIGVNVRSSYYTLYNSWGPTWGRNGRARISRTHMAKLLAENGEACLISQRLNPTR